MQTPSPQPSYVDVTNGNGGTYQEFEFVSQTPSPMPSGVYPPGEGYAPVPHEQKQGYPEVPNRDRRPRYVRYEAMAPPAPPCQQKSRFGIIGFFRKFFADDEGDVIEKAIVEEAKRVADTEEAIENEQIRLDREERREAWSIIQRITEEPVKINAIQAEVVRAQLFWTQASERRSQRAVQRDKAREELSEYRSQRALVKKLKILSVGLTAMCIYFTVRRLTTPAQTPQGGPNNKSMVSKVLVPKNNPSQAPGGQGGAPSSASSQGQVSSAQASSSSCSRRCSW